jgi:ABC-type multidrug transport system fused ATPase/permease subunit
LIKSYFKHTSWLYRAHNLGLSYHSIVVLIALSLVATATEIFGIGIFLPIFQFISFEGDVNALVADSVLWKYIIKWFAFVGLEPSLVVLLVLSFIFFLSRQVFTYIRLVYVVTVRQKIAKTLRDKMFNRYIDADTSYHDKIPVGSLVNVITTEVNGAIAGIMAPLDLIVYLIMLSVYIFMLLLLSWEMTLLSIVVLLFASRIPNDWIKKSKHVGRKLVDANILMSEFLVERLRSPRLVRLSGTEMAEKSAFHQLTQTQRKHSLLNSILQAKTEVVMEPIVIGLSLIFLYFAYTVLHFQVETIGLYSVIVFRLLPVVKGLMMQWQTVQRFLGSIEVVENRLKEMQASFEWDVGVKSLSRLNQSIMMDSVGYSYPAGKSSALKGITIEFKANKVTALVGPSGSGKSTLIDLLPRLRIPTKGSIQIDGLDIKKYELKSLRKVISYAPQFPQIFTGTVKNHILYGKLDATDREIQEAAYLAGAEDFINQLPHGFDTNLGEGAVKLSGGQRQRLDLARALVGKKSILILDEPTSNLDSESEELFKQALYKIRKETNTTIIIVTHRLASVIDADQIIVLNQGKVEAAAVHSELLKQNGWYAKAWKMQV